jgi:hypothetical protein
VTSLLSIIYFALALVAMVFASVGLGWIIDYSKRAKERRFKQRYEDFVNSCRIYKIAAPTEDGYRKLMEEIRLAGKK